MMIELTNNWFYLQSEANQFASSKELASTPHPEWQPAVVPGTVALAVQQQYGRDAALQLKHLDEHDFWYKTEFSLPADGNIMKPVLEFSGLATFCEVWLNGELILRCDNMFRTYRVALKEAQRENHQLMLCFRSLTQGLKQFRARPRWKTKLVERQQLRWVRTTLLGRIPGWTPVVEPVGPWRPIRLIAGNSVVSTQVETHVENGDGFLTIRLRNLPESVQKSVADIRLLSTDERNIDQPLELEQKSGEIKIATIIKAVKLWWPHTHGQPELYHLKLVVTDKNGRCQDVQLEPLGFKTVQINREQGQFRFTVNGCDVFARGACWTSNDIVSLVGDERQLDFVLSAMSKAGANMIRIGGTMIYEQDMFYRRCSELGIMVWQDFMFANMDYPFDDDGFHAQVSAEVEEVLMRLSQHVCVSMYCGNSEIEQQAAMLGLERELWQSDFFSVTLPVLCSEQHPGIPYVTSTPTEGGLPFHTDSGLTHYYGVGAYLRTVSEVVRHNVKFTPECLGFANMPPAATRNRIFAGQTAMTHDPRWKAATPRDTGAGWDFEDVRDHYFRERYALDPVRCRAFDAEKYFQLSELVSGELMAAVYAQWRSSSSHCGGGLVWFLKDFLAGAGWGILDDTGMPKACFYHLKRCWQSRQVLLTDESLNGLQLHVLNERDSVLSGWLQIVFLTYDNARLVDKNIDVEIQAYGAMSLRLDDYLDHFYDSTYSYRFGPPVIQCVSVSLNTESEQKLSQAVYFPDQSIPETASGQAIEYNLREINDTQYRLILKTDQFLYGVFVDVQGYLASDNYFSCIPGDETVILLEKYGDHARPAKGYLSAANMKQQIRLKTS